jgi:protocatechuate 3,4-dioxygenase beta subunit
MNTIYLSILTFITVSLIFGCKGQSKNFTDAPPHKNEVIGGPFENGEFMYIGMPANIKSIDTSAGWTQNGQKLLITGRIFKLDGKTPAPDVILYYYHTDVNGLYTIKSGMDPKVERHGYIRGWVKSDSNGKYAIYTVRPAPYPGRNFEAHIHPAVKEPGIDKEYYIDDFVFDDDTLLTSEKRKNLENRGGSGILRVIQKGDLQIAEHNIILGLNIPDYPENLSAENLSGRHIGEDQPSFMPFHAYGPDKGSRACPVCKYGRYHGIIYFVGNHPDWEDSKKWLLFLEKQSAKRNKYLKVYFVYGSEINYQKNTRQKELETTGEELNLKFVALTFVPSFSDTESEVNLCNINPEVKNTFIIYRNRNIIDKYVNLEPTEKNFRTISNILDSNKGDYFDAE